MTAVCYGVGLQKAHTARPFKIDLQAVGMRDDMDDIAQGLREIVWMIRRWITIRRIKEDLHDIRRAQKDELGGPAVFAQRLKNH